MRVWFSDDLETVATFWRVLRRDGIAVGLTTHDRDLWFDGVLHRASPGMVPSSIKRSAGFDPDSAEVEGALTHDSIPSADLAEGRFDGAHVCIGLVDWQTGDSRILYRGTIGTVIEEDGTFTAELVSRKAELHRDCIPRTSPTCRAPFAGPGCDLDPARVTHEARIAALDLESNTVVLAGLADPSVLSGGWLRWLEGPHAGMRMGIVAVDPAGLVLDTPIDDAVLPDTPVLVREGCDHTLATCASRFANAANFRGEPFLPGNDLLQRYPAPPA